MKSICKNLLPWQKTPTWIWILIGNHFIFWSMLTFRWFQSLLKHKCTLWNDFEVLPLLWLSFRHGSRIVISWATTPGLTGIIYVIQEKRKIYLTCLAMTRTFACRPDVLTPSIQIQEASSLRGWVATGTKMAADLNSRSRSVIISN